MLWLYINSVEKRDRTFHGVNHAFGVQSFVEHELQLRPIFI